MSGFERKLPRTVFFPFYVVAKGRARANEEKDLRRQHPEDSYTQLPSGAYRRLDAHVSEGYDAVVAQLRDNEWLYRMMDGQFSVDGREFPVRIRDRKQFEDTVEQKATHGWTFYLAARVPSARELEAQQRLDRKHL